MVSTSIIKNSSDNFIENCGTYEILCHNCNEKYFGETGRSLEQRIKEHKRDVHNGNISNAMFLHIQEKGHSIDWNSARLIYKCSGFYKRRIDNDRFIS